MGAFDDITKKATAFLNSDQAKQALKSEKAEGISDKVLDGVADAVDKATGGKHSGKIQDAKEAADKKVGDA